MKTNRDRNYDPDKKKDRDKILEMLEQRIPYNDIMRKLGCSLSHVQSLASSHGLTQRVRPRLEDIAKVLHMLVHTDEPMAHIADRLRLTFHQVDRIARAGRKAGWNIKRRVGRPRKEK